MFSRTQGRARLGGRRARTALTTAAALCAAAAVSAVPAQANLASFTPGPPNELPLAYSDGSINLAMCPEGDPNCISADGEGFYFSARSDRLKLSDSNGTVELRLAIESTVDPGPNVFSRVRVKILGGHPGTTYNVVHPYGTTSLTTDGLGDATQTVDTGCLAGTVPPCDYAGALVTAIGPYLTWDDPAAAPPGYIGDPNVLHKVVGATQVDPTSVVAGAKFNAFAVTDDTGDAAFADQFFVQGKFADGIGATPVDFGSLKVGSSATKSLFIANTSAAAVPIGQITAPAGAHAADFATASDTCSNTSIPAGGSCTVAVMFTPAGTGARTAAVDVPWNDGSVHTTTVALRGTGFSPPAPPAPPAPGTGTGTGTGTAAIGQAPLSTVVVTRVIEAAAAARQVAAEASQGVLGTQARPLAVSNLTLSQRISITRLRIQGLRMSMQAPSGANVVRVAVYRARNGQKAGRALFVGYRAPSRAGQFRITLRDRSLLRTLKAGQYIVEIRPGASRSALGSTATLSFRVTR